MAERMQMLAAHMPQQLRPVARDAGTSTSTSMEELDCWQATACQLESRSIERASAEDDASREEWDAKQAEKACAEALALSKRLEREATALRNTQAAKERASAAALEDVKRRTAEACAATTAAEDAANRRSSSSSKSIAALRASIAKETQAANNAEKKAADALEAKLNAKDLPALKKRQKSSEVKAATLEEDCKRLRSQISTVRAETEDSKQGGKLETLEARVSQLDKDCRDLETEGGSSASGDPAVEVASDLAKAQESNRRFLAEVKDARASRDREQSALTQLEKEDAYLKKRCAHFVSIREDVEQQLMDVSKKRALTSAELAKQQARITELEQKVDAVEEDVKTWRDKTQAAAAATRNAKTKRQSLEKKSDLLVWQLQNALMQLEKEKPGAPLSRCLMTSRPREKFKSGCKPRDRMGGSDAGTESVDGEVSTTAGESVTEALLDLGHACN